MKKIILIIIISFFFEFKIFCETQEKTAASATKKTTLTKQSGKSKKTEPADKKTAIKTGKEKKKEKIVDEKKKKKSTSDKKKAEKIEKTIKYGTHKECKQAIIYIPTIKEEKYKKKLEKILIKLIEDEEEPTVIIKSITICEELKLKEAVPVILKKLNHKSEDVKISAVYSFGKFNAITTKPVLIDLLKKQNFTKDSNLTTAIIHTLADFKAVSLKDFVIKKIEDNSTTQNLRHTLIIFLGKSGTSASKDFLLKRFKDPDEELVIRSYAVNSLSKFNDKSITPEINKIAKEINSYSVNKRKEYYSLYMYCITALTRLGDPEAFPFLINSLKSNNANVRLKSIVLLKDLKDKRSIDILRYKAKNDQNGKVRNEAKKVLKEMGIDLDQEAYPELIKALESNNPNTRLKSIKTLKKLKDKRSIDILRDKAKNDKNFKVRQEAKKALKAMEVNPDKEKKDPKKKSKTNTNK